jgi:hypothetical protein
MRNFLNDNNQKCKIITYKELANCRDIDELLNPYDCTVICYLTGSMEYGHWTCLFKNQKGINYFDSYGKPPDNPLDYKSINPDVRKMSHEDYCHLLEMLEECTKEGNRVFYNQFKYQDNNPMTATCGRWCLSRILLKDKTTKQFHKIIQECCSIEKCSPDELVVMLTKDA